MSVDRSPFRQRKTPNVTCPTTFTGPENNMEPANMEPTAGSSERTKSEHVNRVAIRASPFWPEEPELWFAQIENQFALNSIT